MREAERKPKPIKRWKKNNYELRPREKIKYAWSGYMVSPAGAEEKWLSTAVSIDTTEREKLSSTALENGSSNGKEKE